jgi:hypothetical protein
MKTAVIVKRGGFSFQRECDRENIREAVIELRTLYPSAFRNSEGLTACFVSIDQIVGAPEGILIEEFVG